MVNDPFNKLFIFINVPVATPVVGIVKIPLPVPETIIYN